MCKPANAGSKNGQPAPKDNHAPCAAPGRAAHRHAAGWTAWGFGGVLQRARGRQPKVLSIPIPCLGSALCGARQRTAGTSKESAMEYLLKGLFGEKSLTKVVGLYPDAQLAQAAAAKAQHLCGMVPGQVRLLGPQDAKNTHRNLFGRTMEPEQRGIFKTIFQAHAVTGLVGGIAGLLLFFWLMESGQPMVVSSPLLAAIALLGFGITFGLLLGGLIALRPDHIQLITAVRSALSHNRWALVLHPTNAQQTRAAKDFLAASGAEILSTL